MQTLVLEGPGSYVKVCSSTHSKCCILKRIYAAQLCHTRDRMYTLIVVVCTHSAVLNVTVHRSI
jgi:hypothetical protein